MTTTLRGEQSQGRSSVRSSGGVPILDETYHYLVEASSPTIDRLTVLGTAGLPQVGITVSSGGIAVCRTVDAVRRENQRTYWDVTATFSSEVDERQNQQTISGNPTEWIPVYETKFERLQEFSTKDASGDPIANSAGQPFENGLMRSRFIPLWEFFQFELDTVTDEQVIERNETTNLEEFKGRDVGTLLLTVMSSVVGFFYGNRLRLTRYALRYNSEKWTQKRLDVGTVYLDGGKHQPYLDDKDNVILGALDGEGGKQVPGTAPAILEFDMYSAIDFNLFLRV